MTPTTLTGPPTPRDARPQEGKKTTHDARPGGRPPAARRLRRRSATGLLVAVVSVLVLPVSQDWAAEDARSNGSTSVTQPQGGNLSKPPYRGTIHVAPDLYLDSDPSAFESLSYIGRGMCEMFDRRENRRVANSAHRFTAKFADGLSLETRVNPEFSRERSEELARQYMAAFGQLPTDLRRGMRTFDIHDGDEPFGGGGRNVLVHIGMGRRYLESGILPETLFHETVHATIDRRLRDDPGWLAAQEADPAFVSTYAQEHPRREDLAETLLLAIAMAERPDRLPEGMAETLQATIPNRLRFFQQRLAWEIDPTAPQRAAATGPASDGD